MTFVKQPLRLFQNIKKARTATGLSQKQLAKKIGVSDKTISAYETGRAIPPSTTLMKISEITKNPLSKILGIKSDSKDHQVAKKLENIEKRLTQQAIDPKIVSKVKIDTFVGVVLVDQDERVYLIKEEDKYRISLGRWNLPGGSVDNNESLVEAACRETKEETSHKVKIKSLVGCYKCKKGDNSWVYIVFSAELVNNGEEKTDLAVKEGRWFPKNEFLKLDISKIVHSDMKLVYRIAIKNRGLALDSVKYINYDLE